MGVPVLLERVTLSFPHLFEKQAPRGTDNLAYSAEFLIDQSDKASLDTLERAFRSVLTEEGKLDRIAVLKRPWRRGEDINAEAESKGKNPRPEVVGKVCVRAKDANYAPAVMDAMAQPIPESKKDMIFGGCIVNASFDLYWSRNAANPGVYAGLRGVQLVDNVNVTRVGGVDRGAVFKPIEGAPVQRSSASDEESWA